MSISAMKCPMTRPTKRYAVPNIKALLGVFAPTVDVVCCESSAALLALGASEIIPSEYRLAPFPIFSPMPLALFVTCILIFVVPVIFAALKVRQLILAAFRASALFAVRLVEYLFTADVTNERNPPLILIVRHSPKMRPAIGFLLSICPCNPNIPCSRFVLAKMRRTKSRYIVLCHNVSDCPT